jgi:hypothetical protein
MLDLTEAMGKLTDRLRREQDAEGSWMGELASGMNNFYYATSLALSGEPPTHPAIADVCDLIESWATPEGGVPIYAGEPPDSLRTFEGSLLLGWARPRSPVIARARKWLEKADPVGSFPLLNVSRWVLDRSARGSILSEKGPSDRKRRFAMYTWPRTYELFSIRKFYKQPFQPPSPFVRTLFGPMTEWMFWPVVERAHELPGLIPPHVILSILPAYTALRRLADDRSPEHEKLYAMTDRYMSGYRYADGSVLYLNFLPSYMLHAEAFGRPDEKRLLEQGLRKIAYKKGGFMRGSAIAINVLDTAMTVIGLLRCGVSASDPMVAKAASFLRDAQAPNGMWSWGYERAMNGYRLGDTDDTGASCMALEALRDPSDRRAIELGVANVQRLQARSGSILTFDITPASNTPSVSTTARGIQAMIGSGMSPQHPAVVAACEWIASQQEVDGKWVDHWIARWIYGTVLALEGLLAAGYVTPGSPSVERAVSWLLRQQNTDGGWGEDFRGTRGPSTPEHTAMAIYGLGIGSRTESRPVAAMEAGIRWLLSRQSSDGGWAPTYIGAYSMGEGYASSQLPLYWALHAFSEFRKLASARDDRVVRLRRSAAGAAV